MPSYAEFARRLHGLALAQRLPIAGSIELTYRCNLRCVHCYLAPLRDAAVAEHELTTAELRGIIDQVAAAGCLWLLLTGGEPLLRTDFPAIYDHAKGNGLLVSIYTNGTLITPELADHLVEYRPLSVEITLYGMTAATYERVTGIPGSHARCMRGIDLLLERGLPLRLKTMLMTVNEHELEDMEAFAADRGLEFRFDPLLNGTVGANPVPRAYRLTPEAVVGYDVAREKRMQALRDFCQRYADSPQATDELYVCGAGLTSFHVGAAGELSLCMLAREPHYDLRGGSFVAGWREFLPAGRERRRTAASRCSDCRLIHLCPQCPGWSLTEHGDEETPVDYLCQVTHLRARSLGLYTGLD